MFNWLRRVSAIDPAALHEEADAALARGDFVKAETLYRKALEASGDAALYLGLGQALRAQGRAGDAEQHFRRALELEPGRADAALQLALLLHGQGRAEEAA